MKICLDTNILIGTRFSSLEELRANYEIIMNTTKLLTEWPYIFFTEHELLTSPICLWEYLSVRLRGMNFENALRFTDFIHERFNIDTKLSKLTWRLAILLAGATGASCDDAYVYVYSIEKDFDYLATDNRKDLEPITNHRKDAIIKRMKNLVEHYEMTNDGEKIDNIFEGIENLANKRWPEFIFSAADIPT